MLCPILLESDFACLSLEMSIRLFSSHFCFLCCVVLLMCCLCCFWSLLSVFLCSFENNLLVILSMYRCYLQCRWVLYLLFFLDTYSLFISSLGCKALCIVIRLLVLLSISWKFSLVHFKNDPEYLTRCLSLWWDFCNIVWFRVFFSFSWDILFLDFSFVSTCLMASASNILKYLWVFFPLSVLIFSWYCHFIYSLICRFPLFIISMAHFFYAKLYSYIITVYNHCLY